MDISIIIPCHNLEGYIARCLESCLTQKYPADKFEIILVFDSCLDDSKLEARQIINRHPRHKVNCLSINGSNPAHARNAGLEIAEGNFIFFVDGDDYLLHNQVLSDLMSIMKSNSSCNLVYMSQIKSNDERAYIIEKKAIWRWFFKKDLIGNTRFIPKNLNEDIIFVDEILQKTNCCQFELNKPCYFYTFLRPGSQTSKVKTRGISENTKKFILENVVSKMKDL